VIGSPLAAFIANAVHVQVLKYEATPVTKEFISKATSPSPRSSPSRGEDGSNSAPPLRGGVYPPLAAPEATRDEGEGEVCGFTYGLISKSVLERNSFF
jgi:hypothetical protein